AVREMLMLIRVEHGSFRGLQMIRERCVSVAPGPHRKKVHAMAHQQFAVLGAERELAGGGHAQRDVVLSAEAREQNIEAREKAREKSHTLPCRRFFQRSMKR